MMTAVFGLSAFTKAETNKEMAASGQYSCTVEIFLPDGSRFVGGKITVFFHKGSYNDEGGWAEYRLDNNGRCTITWDSKRGDYIERINLHKDYLVITDIKLRDGNSYKLTAKRN